MLEMIKRSGTLEMIKSSGMLEMIKRSGMLEKKLGKGTKVEQA
jgi:hypothetical protein